MVPDAGQAGDPCFVEVAAVSGNDSCDLGLMCWNVDPDTLEGTCAQYCGAEGAEPTCASPDETCTLANHGNLPLCLPACDPLASDCAEGNGCYPTSQADFACVREGERVHIEGVFHTDCPAGTFNAPPDLIEGCSKDAPCCTSFCDQSAESPCGAQGECLPYFEPPMELNPIGYCSSAI